MPSTDGLAYALCTLAYEVVLNRRVHDTQQPTPVEIVLLALGVALSLAAMAWWVTPGATYTQYRSWLVCVFRLHHLMVTRAVPSSAVLRQLHSRAWLDFAFVMVPPGWIAGSILIQLFGTIPPNPAFLLDILTVALIWHKSIAISSLPFVEPLGRYFATTLRLLLRPSLAHPLRGRLSMLGARQKCQVVLMVVHGLAAILFPKLVILELCTQQQRQYCDSAYEGNNGRGNRQPPQGHPPASQLPRTWLSLSGPLRLVVYVLGLQLLIPALLLVASLVTAV